MKKIFIVIILLISINAKTQNTFEGWITYKVQPLNPNSELVPDSVWQKNLIEIIGEDTYMTQKYFYKKDKYMSEIIVGEAKGFQVFNLKDKLLYSWQSNSDTAITTDSKKYMDEFIEIIESNEVDTILGIQCKSIIVKSKMGKMIIWYNSDYFVMNDKFYKGHKYGHWEQIIKKIGCLPLRIEQKGFMIHIVQTAIDFKETTISDEKFEIPKFKHIEKNFME